MPAGHEFPSWCASAEFVDARSGQIVPAGTIVGLMGNPTVACHHQGADDNEGIPWNGATSLGSQS